MKTTFLTNILVITAACAVIGAAPAKSKHDIATQPLTYENVVAHFRSAGMHRTEVQKRCTIFFEGEWKGADVYNYALIIVENSDEDVQVTFYLTDAHEMNWVTEFLDAPFFARNETEKLFGLVSAHRESQTQSVGRYRVAFHHWEPRHADIFVFSFSSLGRMRGN